LRILSLSRFRADAAGTGGQQRRLASLLALAKVGEVDQLILGFDPRASAPDELYLPSLNRPPLPLPGSARFIDPGLFGILQGWSADSPRLNRTDRNRLRDRIVAGRYDLIFANRAAGAATVLMAFAGHPGLPRMITDLDDILSDVIADEVRTRTSALGVQAALRRSLEASLVWRTEQRAIAASAVSYVCSEADRTRLLALNPGADIAVLPNVSRAAFQPRPDRVGRLRLLFVGSLDYAPNIDGLDWFVEAIWPAVRARFGDGVSLTIIGRRGGDGHPPLHGPGIDVFANVASVEPYYRDADACVVPIRYGGGTSIKAVEAMAAGRPLLATPTGVRGLGLTSGRDYLAFTDAASFLVACETLANKPTLSHEIIAAAHGIWQDRFSQTTVDGIIARDIRRFVATVTKAGQIA